MCLFLSLLFLGPRAAILVSWLGWPARWELTFDGFLVPFLGFLIAPWTTLMWVLCAPGGITGFDYFLVGMSVLLDIAAMGGGGAFGRKRYS